MHLGKYTEVRFLKSTIFPFFLVHCEVHKWSRTFSWHSTKIPIIELIRNDELTEIILVDELQTSDPEKKCTCTSSGWPVILEWTVRCSQTVWFFVMFNMFEVQFSAKMWCLEVFEVQSCCYVTRLVLEHTVWCSRTVRFFVMFDMFEVRFWAKMWCSESSMFGHSMLGVFEVQYFGVHSKTKTFWRNVNTYICMPVVSKNMKQILFPLLFVSAKKVQNPKTSICLGQKCFWFTDHS